MWFFKKCFRKVCVLEDALRVVYMIRTYPDFAKEICIYGRVCWNSMQVCWFGDFQFLAATGSLMSGV